MRRYLFALALVFAANGNCVEIIVDGFTDCERANDGRPVCISAATGSYQIVTESFFRDFSARRSYAAGETGFLNAPLESPRLIRAQLVNPADVFASASQSVVFIVTVSTAGGYYGQGSGVVVKPQIIVTNCHVLKGANDVGVFFQNEFYSAPKVLDSQIDRDLCLVQVPGLPAPAIRVGTTTVLRVGQKVLAIGAPHGFDLGLDLTLTEGLISSLRRQQHEEFPIIQTSAPISPGSSGGALLTSDGLLIGITTAGHNSAQNINFAVPVDWVKDFPAAR